MVLSKLHYRFRQYSTLTKTVLLESQYLQSYDSLPDFLGLKFEEDRHNFADIEVQAKLSEAILNMVEIDNAAN